MSQTILQSTSVASKDARAKSTESNAQKNSNALKFKGIISDVRVNEPSQRKRASHSSATNDAVPPGLKSGKLMPTDNASKPAGISQIEGAQIEGAQTSGKEMFELSLENELQTGDKLQSKNAIIFDSMQLHQVALTDGVSDKSGLAHNQLHAIQNGQQPPLEAKLSRNTNSEELTGGIAASTKASANGASKYILTEPLNNVQNINNNVKVDANSLQHNAQNNNFLNSSELNNSALNGSIFTTQKHLFSESLSLTYSVQSAAGDKSKLASIAQSALVGEKPLKFLEQKNSVNVPSMITREALANDDFKLSRLESGLLLDGEKRMSTDKYSSLPVAQHNTALGSSSLSSNATHTSMNPVLSSDSHPEGKSSVKELVLNTTPLVLHSKNWQSSFTQKINWMRSGALERAEIQLDPKELGPLNIRMNQSNGELQITVQSSHSQTRELFELNQERLKEMLQEQGINLSHFDVQSEQKNSESEDALNDDADQNRFLTDNNGDITEKDELQKSSLTTQMTLGQLDFFV